MRRLLLLVALASTCLSGFAQSYTIPANASASVIQGVFNQAAAYTGSGTVTINVAAGTSSSLSQVVFTCPHVQTVLSGPITGYPYAWNARPSAIWRGASLDQQLIYLPTCSVPRAVLYMELDGNQPATGGGGIEIAQGTTGTTIMWDYIHGNEEKYPAPCNNSGCGVTPSSATYYGYDDTASTLVLLDGSSNGTATNQVNTLVQYNIFGNPVQTYPTNQATTDGVNHSVATSNGDCVNVQQWVQGTPGNLSESAGSSGGNCSSFGQHGGTTNTRFFDNVVQNQEQGMKFFSCGSSTTTYCYDLSEDIERNSFSGIHRIGIEAQQTPADTGNVNNFIVRNNVYSNPKDPTYISWGFSLPQGGYGRTNEDSNLMISDCGNAANPNFCAQNHSETNFFEYWGSNGASANYNLMQVNSTGAISGGVSWGYGGYANSNTGYYGTSQCQPGAAPSSCWQSIYNTCEGQNVGTNGNPGHCVATEGEQSTNPPLVSNLVVNSSASAHASNTPTASPASGTAFNGTLTVTLSVAQFSSTTALPQGNQNIWYTTDGSTPAPKSGTSQFYQGPFTINSTTTVKAVGMWGGPTQPSTYTVNMGFVPSSVMSATYTTSGTAITLSGVSTACPLVSLTAGGATTQCTATASYSNGTSDDVTSSADARGYGPAVWSSSATSIATVNAGLVTPIAVGNANISATLGVAPSNIVPISVVTSMGGGGGGTGGTVLVGGQSQNDFAGTTYAGSTNDLYYVTGSASGGYVPGQCHMILPGAVTSGKHYDCLLISAPSATTEATTYTCKGTYTTTSTAAPGTINITLSGCPATLAANTAWWIATITDDPKAPVSMGFYDCGGTSACNSTVPTMGVGTYQGRYLGGLTYGSYGSLSSTFTGTNVNQPTQWIDLTQAVAAVTLTGAYQGNATSLNIMVRGNAYLQHAYCVYSDSVIQECDGTADARGDVVTSWGENSGGVVLAVGGSPTTFSNIDDSLTNWETVCTYNPGGCNPGGTDTPASTPTQTINNASPSLDGESMQLSFTTKTTSTQTNALWRFLAPSTCDLCTTFTTSQHFYMPTLSSLNNYEFGLNDFDQTENLQLTFEHQCNLSNNLFQIANGVGSWVNTTAPCTFTAATWHTVLTSGHRNLGDTSCGGKPTLYFDSITVDGTAYNINQTLCAVALPTGFTSALIMQYQMDQGATTTATTRSLYLDEASFTASSGTLGLITGLNYGTANSTCVINGTLNCSPWTWKITNVPATADQYQGMTLKGMQIN